ncbi:MAG: arginase family protein [Synechococcales cyanobacterium]
MLQMIFQPIGIAVARWSLQPLSSTQAQVILIPTAFGMDTQAPAAILAAGSQVCGFEPLLHCDVDDLAVGQITPFHDEPPYAMCETAVQNSLARQQWPVLLPSAMAASVGAIRALWKRQGSLNVVYCSAHAGVKPPPEYLDGEGDPAYSSQSWVERLYQIPVPVIHIGLRSSSRRAWEMLPHAHVFHAQASWHPEDVLAVLPDQPTFLAIDCNVLDPTLVPTVINPEPGGIPWFVLQQTVRTIFAHRPVVGASLGGLTVANNTRQTARYGARLLNWILACHQAHPHTLLRKEL